MTRSWALLVAPLTFGCSQILGYDQLETREPSAERRIDESGPNDGATDAIDPPMSPDGGCAMSGGTICAANGTIPPFREPSQRVDGQGDEFCDVAPTVLLAEKGAYVHPSPPPKSQVAASIRVAWSNAALHVHVHVDDAHVLVAPMDRSLDLWNGDSIDLFVSGRWPLDGRYDPTSDPHTHFLTVAPPSVDGTIPARATIRDTASHATVLLPSEMWAARLVPQGYDVELRVPWSWLGSTPAAGKEIGIDFALNVDDDATKAGREMWSLLGLRAPPTWPASPCSAPNYLPWCDDRTWCSVTLGSFGLDPGGA